jgi:hypothetical protein
MIMKLSYVHSPLRHGRYGNHRHRNPRKNNFPPRSSRIHGGLSLNPRISAIGGLEQIHCGLFDSEKRYF